MTVGTPPDSGLAIQYCARKMVGPVVTSEWPRCTVSFHKAPAKGGLPGESPASFCSLITSARMSHGPEAQAAGPEEGSDRPAGDQEDPRLWETALAWLATRPWASQGEKELLVQRGNRALTSPAGRSVWENEPQGTFLTLLSVTRMEKERLQNHKRQAHERGLTQETSEVLRKQASTYKCRSQAPDRSLHSQRSLLII